MRLIKTVLIAVVLSFMLCSCGDEPDNMAYIVAMGFDKAENNNYYVTIQYAKTAKISGGDSENGGEGGPDIIQNLTVEAPNMYSAINIANHIVSKKFSLSHTELLVFSEELALEGIGDIIDTVSKSNEIRPDIFAAVAIGGARRYLEEVKPTIEVNPAKYYKLIYSQNDTDGIPKTDLQDFYINKATDNAAPVLPIAGVSENDGGEYQGEDAQSIYSFDYNVKNYIAGEVAVQSENKSEAMGMAVFEEDKMTAVLGAVDTEIYNLLKGSLKRNYISFKNEDNNEPIMIKIYQVRKPLIKVDLDNKKINILLNLESDLLSKPVDNFDVKSTEANVVKEIKIACTSFMDKTINKMNCDVLGIKKEIRKKFSNNKNFLDYNYSLKDFKIEIEPVFSIRRIGMKL